MEYRLDYVAILMGDVDVYGLHEQKIRENLCENFYQFLIFPSFFDDHFSRITVQML